MQFPVRTSSADPLLCVDQIDHAVTLYRQTRRRLCLTVGIPEDLFELRELLYERISWPITWKNESGCTTWIFSSRPDVQFGTIADMVTYSPWINQPVFSGDENDRDSILWRANDSVLWFFIERVDGYLPFTVESVEPAAMMPRSCCDGCLQRVKCVLRGYLPFTEGHEVLFNRRKDVFRVRARRSCVWRERRLAQ